MRLRLGQLGPACRMHGTLRTFETHLLESHLLDAMTDEAFENVVQSDGGAGNETNAGILNQTGEEGPCSGVMEISFESVELSEAIDPLCPAVALVKPG